MFPNLSKQGDKVKMKKLVALLLAAALCLCLFVGCSGSGTKTPAATAAQGSSGTTAAAPIKIGGIGPLTGGAAIYGNAAKNGATIAVEEINALGGLQFELRYEDDAHDAEKSVNAYNTLKGWGMQIFLGSVTSTPCVATSVEANNDHIFLLTPSASSTDVLGGISNPLTGTVDIPRKDTVFQMCFVDPNQGSASAQYISDQKLATKIAVIYKNDDVYSTGVYNSFAPKAQELGLEIVSTTTFTEDTKTDFSVQLNNAKSAGADLVFLPMYYDAAALILTQANAMGYAPKWFGIDGMDGILSVDGFDTALAEGVMLLTPFSADAQDEKTVNFVKTYKDLYGEVPNQFAADAYDGVYALVEAAMQAGVQTGDSAEDICDAMIAAMQQITYEGVTGTMTWDATGAVSKTPTAVVIENGVYVGFDK
jgi:branched-chain amino acid transport system substrate-binding protein